MSERPTLGAWELVRARACLPDTVVAASASGLGVLCLIPLFADLQWLPPALVAVLVVAVIGAAGRAIAMPLPLLPVVELIGVVVLLTIVFAGDSAWAHLVPTSNSMEALRSLLHDGMIDASTLAAPVPTSAHLILLAVGGAGLAALSIDTLFVCVRSPILAGIPLLVLYTGSALLLFDDAPWWQFPPAAAGWLLLLAADQRDRVREWASHDLAAPVRGLSSTARRTGLAAVVIALVAAAILPLRGPAPWMVPGGEGGPGVPVASSIVLDPLVTMRRDLLQITDTEVLRYRTENPRPSYLRVTALENFDGEAWRPRPALAQQSTESVQLPGNVQEQLRAELPEYRVTSGSTYTYLISVTGLENPFLPLPYPTVSVADLTGMGQEWRLDPTTGVGYSDGVPATGLKYGVTAIDKGLLPEQLREVAAPAGDLWPLLSVPGDLPAIVGDLATQVTATAKNPYDKALALQQWFTKDGGFTYSIGVAGGSGDDYLASFLTERFGYCEQFAASMALMARTLGIPSRVIVGFTQGRQQPDGSWLVTARDAHAWPELWFDGIGWVRFEPTPRANSTLQAPAYAPVSPLVTDGTFGDERRRGPSVDEQPATTAAARSFSGTSLVILGIVILALAIGCVPMMRRWLRRRRRLHGHGYREAVLDAWAEIADTAIDLGQPWSPFDTPRQAARRLSRGMPPAAAGALNRLRSEVEQVRYGVTLGEHAAAQEERAAAVRADVVTVCASLRDRVRWQTRVVAYSWPPSARRRQRSSNRSMSPGALGAGGAEAVAVAASSSGRAEKAE